MSAFKDEFTGLYSLSKTIRFALKPVPETLKALEEDNSILLGDMHRSREYPVIKELLDNYYRYYIEEELSAFCLDKGLIQKAYEAYCLHNEKTYDNLCALLRVSFSKAFAHQGEYLLDKYKDLVSLTEKKTEKVEQGGKKRTVSTLVSSKLLLWMKKTFSPEQIERYRRAIETFSGFTTYLVGYKETRDNMFSTEPKASAIAFRVINQNMSFFFNNIRAFEKIRQKYPDLYKQLAVFEEYFKPEAFADILSQSKIDEYNYHCIGRPIEDSDYKGVNSLINEFRQKNGIKNRELPTMRMLYKQILSDREAAFFVKILTSQEDAIALAKESYSMTYNEYLKLKMFINENLTNSNLENVFIKTQALTDIAQNMFSDWTVFKNALEAVGFKDEIISLNDLEVLFKAYCNGLDTEDRLRYTVQYDIFGYFKQEMELNESLIPDKVTKVNQYKEQLDSLLNAIRRFKCLYLFKGKQQMQIPDEGIDFSTAFNELYEKVSVFAKAYDTIRNFATKKPYSEEKIKLNLNLPTLLAGWDVNKEADNASFLFEKKGKFYLGIADKASKKIFDMKNKDMQVALTQCDDNYNKILYKQISGSSKMLPKVIFGAANTKIFGSIITDRILEIRENKLYTAAKNDRQAAIEWIDFMKQAVEMHPEWNEYFTYHFKPSKEYANVNEFYEDMDKQSYSLSKVPVNASYIEKLVKEHKLFLFQLYTKDFSDNKKKKGTDNLHTMYWKAVFSSENLQTLAEGTQPIFKLNGEAEIFLREPSLERRITHPKNEPLKNKNVLNPKKESLFEYDLIKNKRFTERKFFFHCPITINFRADKINTSTFNRKVNSFIENNPDVCLIGIDRGERHLLYYTVINQKGEILEQASLNCISNKYVDNGGNLIEKITDYHSLLDRKESDKHNAQKAWATIENIKELKAGYLSQVVHKLAQLMVKYNAVVVLENLNLNFKRSRIKVEKQVYQKFEKALIEKLNYLVFKDKGYEMNGSYAKGLQLAAPFESFKKLQNQTGCIYYVVPSYTSHIDPKTGFVNLLNANLKYESIKKSVETLKKIDVIKFNSEKGYFEFAFDYKNFGKDIRMAKTQWTVCTYGDIRWSRSKKDTQPTAYCVTEKLKELFDANGIDYASGQNILADIVKVENKTFLSALLFYLRLVLQMRYTVHGCQNENDYILSPVEYAPGQFFDSRKAGIDEPQNADSNGAYHIALKGLMTIKRITAGEVARFKEGEERQEWFKFMQNKEYEA